MADAATTVEGGTIYTRDGRELPLSADNLKGEIERAFGRTPLKETPEDAATRDRVYSVTAGELRQFIERFERLDAEKRDIADQQREVMAEAKGRGYCTKTLRKVIARRKRSADDLAEEEAVLQVYLDALGMD